MKWGAGGPTNIVSSGERKETAVEGCLSPGENQQRPRNRRNNLVWFEKPKKGKESREVLLEIETTLLEGRCGYCYWGVF